MTDTTQSNLTCLTPYRSSKKRNKVMVRQVDIIEPTNTNLNCEMDLTSLQLNPATRNQKTSQGGGSSYDGLDIF